MRTIKFRGKRKLNGEWVYGSLISIGDDWCQIVPEGTDYDALKEDLPIIRVITDTIGQFTGMFDKNGVEIYEGDKVKCPYGEGIVVYNVGCFMVEWTDESECLMELLFSRNGYRPREDDEVFEVIGNNHE